MAARYQRRYTAAEAFDMMFGESGEDDVDSDVDRDDISDQEEENSTENETSSEDEENQHIMQQSSDTNGQHKYISPDGTVWQKHPPVGNPQGRLQRHNIVRISAGVNRQFAEKAMTPFGAFSCFITSDILEIIVKCTNEEGQRIFGDNWKHTNEDELKTYLGLLIIAGVYRGRLEPVVHLWNQNSGRPIFNKAMSRNRFQQLTRTLRFDTKATRDERRQRDKLAPIREIHDKFASRCRAVYRPGDQVCVDEQLVAFRGRCPFKVYIPSKPGKYGIKVWACCDVDTAYCCNLEVYTGKQGRGPEVGQPTRVVLQMTEHLSNSGRGCTADNFFTSLTLADTLLSRQMTFCGTVRKNKRFIPPVLKEKGREVYSSQFVFSGNQTLVSYIPKKEKNVILLSTQHHEVNVHDNRDDKKPEIILHYNKTKPPVDTLDQLVRTYTTQRKSRRWPMILFQNFLDIACYNAFVIFLECNPDYNRGKSHRRRIFLESLGMDMVAEAIEARQPHAVLDVAPPLGPNFRRGEPVGAGPRKRIRCGKCTRLTDRKTVERCSSCNIPICTGHSRQVCNPQCN